jgi:hypothetical protein
MFCLLDGGSFHSSFSQNNLENYAEKKGSNTFASAGAFGGLGYDYHGNQEQIF